MTSRNLPLPHLHVHSDRRSPADLSAAASLQVLRDAAAACEFEYPHSVGRRGGPAAASPTADAAAGHHRFGGGPSIHQPGSIEQGRARHRVTCSAAAKFNLHRLCEQSSRLPNATRAGLELGQFAQTLLDMLTVLYLGFFAALFACSILMAVFLLLHLS
jgi:hypothetical protein